MRAWLNRPLEDYVDCPFLRRGLKNRIAETIRMCTNNDLIRNPTERAQRLKTSLEDARDAVSNYESRQNQMNARAQFIYSCTLSSTKYSGPPAAGSGGPQKGKHGGQVHGTQPAKKPTKAAKPVKLSKADQIKQDNAARLAAKGACKQVRQSLALRATGCVAVCNALTCT